MIEKSQHIHSTCVQCGKYGNVDACIIQHIESNHIKATVLQMIFSTDDTPTQSYIKHVYQYV